MTKLVPPFRIGVDTGGTFTDVVVQDSAGAVILDKALTTPDRAFDAITEALTVIAARVEMPAERLIAESELFLYGTTRATNAILEEAVATTAFFTTAGFPDILTLREGGKLRPFDFSAPSPKPLVPPALTFEIGGRIDGQGVELEPLDEDSVATATREAQSRGAEAVSVTLLWSIVNPKHELRAGEIINEVAPELAVTLSHELNPIIREYRRASSATLDASLKPLMQQHLGDLASDLRAADFPGRLLVVVSNGGSVSASEAREKPLLCVNSGPSMAPVAAHLHARECDLDSDLIVCDTGGTSFDVSLVRDGSVATTRESWLGGVFQGHITGLSSVQVTSIGAGGGSIAWIDDGNLLRVGPRSAGSRPGPCCYGLGGTEPTVTDAAVVLGYLSPERFLAGRMPLDAEAAVEAVRAHVAEPLGLGIEQAALAIITVANEAMVAAIQEITVNQGVDPRACTMVVGGGAGGLSGATLAEALGCSRALVPATAGALSASGASRADIVKDFAVRGDVTTRTFDLGPIGAAFGGLKQDAAAFLESLPSALTARTGVEFSAEARYPSQVWELDVPLPRAVENRSDASEIEERFHAIHERTFAVSEPGQEVEIQLWKARARAALVQPAELAVGAWADNGVDEHGSREAYFEGIGRVRTATLGPGELAVGEPLQGPAVLEERATTVVVPPGWTCERTRSGHYMLRKEGGAR